MNNKPLLIFWEDAQGNRFETEARPGDNMMLLARWAGVPGIQGECGGALRCATCHVIVPEAWRDCLPAPGPEEQDMLVAVRKPSEAGSRLSCQLLVNAACDGLILRVP